MDISEVLRKDKKRYMGKRWERRRREVGWPPEAGRGRQDTQRYLGSVFCPHLGLILLVSRVVGE